MVDTQRLTVAAAASRYGVTPETVRRWCRSGSLPVTRTPGGHYRIEAEIWDEKFNSMKKVTTNHYKSLQTVS